MSHIPHITRAANDNGMPLSDLALIIGLLTIAAGGIVGLCHSLLGG